MRDWTRRGLLVRGAVGVGAVGVGAVALSAVACARREDGTWDPARLSLMRERIPQVDRIGALARAETSPAGLAAALGTKHGLCQAMTAECPATAMARAGDQVRQDYRDGDIVVIGRWVLARSEVLIAAVT